jgi:four helix bundle protein
MISYKELIVWQKSFDVTIEIYRVTKSFPQEELFGLTSQMRRAAVSISSNIVEGNTRGGTKEYVHFLRIAYSSAAELESQLLISKTLSLINNDDYTTISALLTEIMKMLRTIITKLSVQN